MSLTSLEFHVVSGRKPEKLASNILPVLADLDSNRLGTAAGGLDGHQGLPCPLSTLPAWGELQALWSKDTPSLFLWRLPQGKGGWT